MSFARQLNECIHSTLVDTMERSEFYEGEQPCYTGDTWVYSAAHSCSESLSEPSICSLKLRDFQAVVGVLSNAQPQKNEWMNQLLLDMASCDAGTAGPLLYQLVLEGDYSVFQRGLEILIDVLLTSGNRLLLLFPQEALPLPLQMQVADAQIYLLDTYEGSFVLQFAVIGNSTMASQVAAAIQSQVGDVVTVDNGTMNYVIGELKQLSAEVFNNTANGTITTAAPTKSVDGSDEDVEIGNCGLGIRVVMAWALVIICFFGAS